mgnify:CR=1 FL=1
MEKIEIKVEEKTIKMPVINGNEGEKAIDISQLRKEAGFITFDPGYQNTASCKSAITYVDGEKGILRYRGYPIEELGKKSTPLEVAYLLIYGKLPLEKELTDFRNRIADYSYLHPGMLSFFDNIPSTAHPMAILSSAINSFSMYFSNFYTEEARIIFLL